MAQAQPSLSMTGQTEGNLRYCTSCGSNLELVDGTDPDETDELGGFEEEYECSSCGGRGTYTYRNTDAKEVFTGICAGEHMWE